MPPIHPKWNLGIAQSKAVVGDVTRNLEIAADYVRRAKDADVQLLLFPELALTGYSVGHEFPELAVRLDGPEIDRLKALSKQVDLVMGLIEETPDARFFNSAVCFSDGEIRHVHRKIYPPTYGIFEERRYFGAGSDLRAFDTPWGRIAMLICGDCWHLSLPYLAACDGADILLILAASSEQSLTQTIPSQDAWERLTRSYALTLSFFVAFGNRVGHDGDLRFWGGSHVVIPDSGLAAQARLHDEELLVAEIDLNRVRHQRIVLPFRRDDNLELTARIAQRILAAHTGFPPAFL